MAVPCGAGTTGRGRGTANGKADDHFNEIAVSNVGVVFDAEYGLTIFALKSAKPWRIRPQIPVSVKSW